MPNVTARNQFQIFQDFTYPQTNDTIIFLVDKIEIHQFYSLKKVTVIHKYNVVVRTIAHYVYPGSVW